LVNFWLKKLQPAPQHARKEVQNDVLDRSPLSPEIVHSPNQARRPAVIANPRIQSPLRLKRTFSGSIIQKKNFELNIKVCQQQHLNDLIKFIPKKITREVLTQIV
jgi:hypothetical protein